MRARILNQHTTQLSGGSAFNSSCPVWDVLPHLTKAEILLAETRMIRKQHAR